MQYNKSIIPELALLHTAKAAICITMIIPVSASNPASGKLSVLKMIRRTKQFLKHNYKPNEIADLLPGMDEMTEGLYIEPDTQGIGFYLSSTIKRLVCFPFPVVERMLISDRFELRELMYKEDCATPYCVLLLTEQHARLFNGMLNSLSEVKDGEFPLINDIEYEYMMPAPGSSGSGYAHTKSVEKDKSLLESIHLEKFFRKVDKSLSHYLISGRKLIVLAVRKELSLFAEATHHRKGIIGHREGNYDKADGKELVRITWPLMKEWLKKPHLEMLREFTEKTGVGMGVPGIQDSWSAAHEGKALKLLVEKDYRQAGFVTGNERQLHLRPSKNTTRIVTDAVDDVIETVLEKNGEVYFFDNGALQDFNRIAVISRYK